MPGLPFQSSLEPHLETIRALRLKRRTWQQVAETLKAEHDLEIDRSAVYKFFKRRVQPSARQPLGFPAPTAPSGSRAGVPPVPASEGAAPDLSFEPIDPDAENPFKMRKRQAQRLASNAGEVAPPNAAPAPAGKKDYVFIPKPKAPSRFSDEDLEFNDPLKEGRTKDAGGSQNSATPATPAEADKQHVATAKQPRRSRRPEIH